MTKSIASYPEHQREAVIKRRLAGRGKGSGYQAALSAAKTLGIAIQERKPFKQREEAERKPRPEKKQWRKPSIRNNMRVIKGN